jgi:hypothetical protein
VDEGLGHFQADVAAADDDRGPGLLLVECGGDRERVAHAVQQVHPVAGSEHVQSGDGWTYRQRTGGHQQLVVAEHSFLAAAFRPHPMVCHVDGGGAGVQLQAQPGRLQRGLVALGQVPPVGHLTEQLVRDPADRETALTIASGLRAGAARPRSVAA